MTISAVLFNLRLERGLKETGIGPQKVLMFKSSVRLLIYVGDLALMDKLHDGLRTLFSRLEVVAKKVGLWTNKEKYGHGKKRKHETEEKKLMIL